MQDIKLDQTEIDLAKMQNKDINLVKTEQLKYEKKRRISELNQKFGVQSSKKADKPKIRFADDESHPDRHEKLWEMLQGNVLKAKK